MSNDWLLEVLRDIGDYAEKNDLPWLTPLMDQAYRAAEKELAFRAPVPLLTSRATRTENDRHPKSKPVESSTVVAFPFDRLNVRMGRWGQK